MRAAVVACFALAACFDPDLGARPFLCGTSDPRCPDGYTPVDVSEVRCECRRGQATSDAAGYACIADRNEPNDAPAAATPTIIGRMNRAQSFPNLAVCPAADVDAFALAIDAAETLITARVAFDAVRQPPIVDILDPDQVSLEPARSSPQVGALEAVAAAPRTGRYFIRLSAPEAVNYSLSIEIAPP